MLLLLPLPINPHTTGYGLFQGLGALGLLTQHLTIAENVIVQTTAVATATMPLAAGALLLLLHFMKSHTARAVMMLNLAGGCTDSMHLQTQSPPSSCCSATTAHTSANTWCSLPTLLAAWAAHQHADFCLSSCRSATPYRPGGHNPCSRITHKRGAPCRAHSAKPLAAASMVLQPGVLWCVCGSAAALPDDHPGEAAVSIWYSNSQRD
jgi:hypothetical protein